MARKQYKVIHVVEGGISTLLFGSSGLPIQKMEDTLNHEGAEGWEVVFMVLERKRFLLFWQREAVLITLARDI